MADDKDISSYLFFVEIDGIETARFQKCEGLEAETSVFEYEEKYDKENFNILLNAITDYFKRNPDLYKKIKKDKKKKIKLIISSKLKVIKHLREDIVDLKNLLKAINARGIK